MGEGAGVFTLVAQLTPLGNIFGVDERHAEELWTHPFSLSLERGGTFLEEGGLITIFSHSIVEKCNSIKLIYDKEKIYIGATQVESAK